MCCGAIISNYQRHRVENVCKRLDFTSLSYLWQRNRVHLLDYLISNDVTAVLVKVSGYGLNPRKHLNKTLAEMKMILHNNNRKYGLDVCGEGGEYESLVLVSIVVFRLHSISTEEAVL